jgi:hypothetical protein
MFIKEYNNNHYLIIFIYNFIKLIFIYLIKIKDKIINYFIYFKKYYKYLNFN